MVVHALAANASKALPRVSTKVAKRTMGSGGPKPEWTGIDKVVRNVFPEDYQLAGAILGGYGVLILGAAVMPSSKKAAAPAPAAASSAIPASGGDLIPAVDSPEFEKFVESDAFNKFVENEDSLNKWISSLDK